MTAKPSPRLHRSAVPGSRVPAQASQPGAAASVAAGGPPASAERALLRIGAVTAVLGIVLEVVMDQLHPSGADPNDSAAAFAEHARSGDWAYVHIGQFLGTLCIVLTLVALGRPLARQAGVAGALA